MMGPTIDQALQQGVDAQKAGRLQEAREIYQRILSIAPRHPIGNSNMGIIAIQTNRPQDARNFFQLAFEEQPTNAQFARNYIISLIEGGLNAEVDQVLSDAKTAGLEPIELDRLFKIFVAHNANKGAEGFTKTSEPTGEQLRPAIEMYNRGNLKSAQKFITALQKKLPNSFLLNNFDGILRVEAGDLELAVNYFKKSIKIKPDFADAYNNMATAQKKLGQIELAMECFERAIQIRPDYVEAHYNLGLVALENDNLVTAIESFKRAVHLKADYAEAHLNLGNAQKRSGFLQAALICYERSIQIRPDFAEVYLQKGIVLKELGDISGARNCYGQALKVNPNYVTAHFNLALIFHQCDEIPKAIESYEKTLELDPNFVNAHYNLVTLKKFHDKDEQLVQMEKLYKCRNLDGEKHCRLCFSLAKVNEDIRNFDQSFSYLKEGNALRKNILGYNFSSDEALFLNLKSKSAAIFKQRINPEFEQNSPVPVFIVGMPRSGTTLVEQIISSHSKVSAGGELGFISLFGSDLALGGVEITQEAIYAFREKYNSKLKALSCGKSYLTDKTPQNFRFIGLILAAFPEAKVIHVKRQAEATCWSNFKHYFTTSGIGYAYNLADIVAYYRLYEDLMNFWYMSFPGKIYELDYDGLTVSQEVYTKKLIKFIGLSWSPIFLSPHANKRSPQTASRQQVKKKVYQGSSQQWQKFKPYIGDIFDQFQKL
ncbi:MAG: tetratricopeptide (TPR) repeat protein [Paracoccaceae bacterium]|jgi:tetratricopeptide (TPR) repeat protein